MGLPKRPVRLFVGRSEQLHQLDDLVCRGAGVATHVVHGLGGVGKSELAMQYAIHHRARYAVVWWITADGPETVESGLAELAFQLRPDVQVIATRQEAATWALIWLQSHGSWLVVLDNVEHLHHVESLLAQLTAGHVIITSRRELGWDNIADGSLRLDVLSRATAVELLNQLSGQTDTEGVLAEELGFLPLALQQAAAYLRQTRTSMDRYLHRLRMEPAHVLAQVAFGDDTDRAVARTWSLSVVEVGRQNPLAIQLLKILSCFASYGLPREVVSPIAESDEVDAALGLLASYSLISLTTSQVTVHRLVQAVTAGSVRRPSAPAGSDYDEVVRGGPSLDWADTLRTAVNLLTRSAPPDDPAENMAGWSRWAALSPHIAAVAASCPDEIGGLDLAWLLDKAGDFERAQGRYRQAVVLKTRVLTYKEAVLGPDHPDLATTMDSLGGSLRDLGRLGEAEALQRRALAITDAAHGPDHHDVGVRLNSLGTTLQQLGRASEAYDLHRRALAMLEAEHGQENLYIAATLNNLGITLRDLDRPHEAEPMQRRAVRIVETALGPNHPDLATGLDNLGGSLRDMGRANEAELLRRRAVSIAEEALGPLHPEFASKLSNLAGCVADLGRVDEAESLQRRALEVTEAALGPEHPDVATRLNNLAQSLRDRGRPDEAEQLQRRALSILERSFPPNHPHLTYCLENLASILDDLNHTDEAEQLRRRAAGIKTTKADSRSDKGEPP